MIFGLQNCKLWLDPHFVHKFIHRDALCGNRRFILRLYKQMLFEIQPQHKALKGENKF